MPQVKIGSQYTKDVGHSIILVHGLNSTSEEEEAHALNTWTEGGRLWPRDDLPKRLPDARISLYIYHSSGAFGSQPRFAKKANELLETIRCDRENWEARPLILMGYSFGGLLIKQALVNASRNRTYQHVCDATYDLPYLQYFQVLTENSRTGLAFFGTPHGGGEGMVTLGITASVDSWLGIKGRDKTIEIFNNKFEFLDILEEDFRLQLESYRTVSFWDNRDMVCSIASRNE